MKRLAVCLLLGLLFGCASQSIHPAYYDVVHSHRDLTVQTLDDVKAAIVAELNGRNDLTIDQIGEIKKLIAKLDFIELQAVVMDKYATQKMLTEAQIQELIRYRWKEGN